jgi:Domain of unknown function (DUF4249)
MKNLLKRYHSSRAMFTQALLITMSVMLLFAIGCEENPSEADDFDPLPTLYSYIQNGAPVDTVNLEWTSAYNAYYDPTELGIQGAQIVIFPVQDENGALLDTTDNDINDYVIHLRTTAGREFYGEYIPVDNDYLRPRGLWTYRIEAKKPAEGVNLWAETTVPDTFSFLLPVNVDGDTLTREDDEIYINWTESESARGFVLGIVAETPRDELIPLDPEWDPNDPDDFIEDEDRNRHGWTIARYDQRSMTIAWIFFDWSAWNRLYINAASKSYYEYMLSLTQQGDPSWTVNPAYNINGGIGVFGAYATHEFDIYLERVAPNP